MSDLFRKAYGLVFRRSAFDDHFHMMTMTILRHPHPSLDGQMRKRFLEIKNYWREESPASMPPEMAAWKAVEDFALWLHKNKRDDQGEDDLLVQLAGSLFFKYPESIQDKINRGMRFPGPKSLEPYHVLYLATLNTRG